MKITDVTLRKAKHYLFVQIHTDEGIVGLGEAGNWAYLNATAATIEKLAGYLIGKDPFRIEDFNQNFMRAQYFRGSVIMSAISAIDIALWDIKGKKLGVPVYELLGGRVRDKVRVYASPMSKETDPESLVNSYRQLKEMGFTAAKIFVNGPMRSQKEGRDEFFCGRIEDELEKVRLCREAVGKDFDLILEVHRGMTLPEAVTFGRAVEAYRPMVLEDPVPPDNYDTMAEVASKVGVPIASGERFTKLREVNITANTSRVEIDLSGVDWSQWDKVHLDYLFTDTIAMWVYLNVADEDIQFYSIGSNIPVGMYAPRLTLYVGFQENRQVWSNQNQKDDLMVSYSQLTKLIFSDSNMTPGTHFVLWGEK